MAGNPATEKSKKSGQPRQRPKIDTALASGSAYPALTAGHSPIPTSITSAWSSRPTASTSLTTPDSCPPGDYVGVTQSATLAPRPPWGTDLDKPAFTTSMQSLGLPSTNASVSKPLGGLGMPLSGPRSAPFAITNHHDASKQPKPSYGQHRNEPNRTVTTPSTAPLPQLPSDTAHPTALPTPILDVSLAKFQLSNAPNPAVASQHPRHPAGEAKSNQERVVACPAQASFSNIQSPLSTLTQPHGVGVKDEVFYETVQGDSFKELNKNGYLIKEAFPTALGIVNNLNPGQFQLKEGDRMICIKTDFVANVHYGIKNMMWATIAPVGIRINRLWEERPDKKNDVLLLVSINGQKSYCALGKMRSPWTEAALPAEWRTKDDGTHPTGTLHVEWNFVKNVSYERFRHLFHPGHPDRPKSDPLPIVNMWNGMHYPHDAGREVIKIYVEAVHFTNVLAYRMDRPYNPYHAVHSALHLDPSLGSKKKVAETPKGNRGRGPPKNLAEKPTQPKTKPTPFATPTKPHPVNTMALVRYGPGSPTQPRTPFPPKSPMHARHGGSPLNQFTTPPQTLDGYVSLSPRPVQIVRGFVDQYGRYHEVDAGPIPKSTRQTPSFGPPMASRAWDTPPPMANQPFTNHAGTHMASPSGFRNTPGAMAPPASPMVSRGPIYNALNLPQMIRGPDGELYQQKPFASNKRPMPQEFHNQAGFNGESSPTANMRMESKTGAKHRGYHTAGPNDNVDKPSRMNVAVGEPTGAQLQATVQKPSVVHIPSTASSAKASEVHDLSEQNIISQATASTHILRAAASRSNIFVPQAAATEDAASKAAPAEASTPQMIGVDSKVPSQEGDSSIDDEKYGITVQSRSTLSQLTKVNYRAQETEISSEIEDLEEVKKLQDSWEFTKANQKLTEIIAKRKAKAEAVRDLAIAEYADRITLWLDSNQSEFDGSRPPSPMASEVGFASQIADEDYEKMKHACADEEKMEWEAQVKETEEIENEHMKEDEDTTAGGVALE